jgi:hypothetical protein
MRCLISLSINMMSFVYTDRDSYQASFVKDCYTIMNCLFNIPEKYPFSGVEGAQ